MQHIITNLSTAGCSRALQAALMILPLSLSGCFDDKKTDAPPVESFDLAVNVIGSGSVSSSPAGIDCGSDCVETLTSGNTITLSATPASGAMFTDWGGDCSGSTLSCTLTMNASRAVSASFTFITDPPPPAAQYTLNVSVTGTGSVTSSPAGISCGTDCTENYADGTSVTLTATPGTGFQFSSWSGACSGTGSCVVAMSAARSVTATFSANPPPAAQYTLSVSVTGTGSVSSNPAGISCGADCTENYTDSTSVTLTATPGANQQFSGWANACTGTQLTCTVSMTAARSASASFTPVLRALTVTLNGTGSVTSAPAGINCGTDCSENYAHGSNVTLTATPGANQQFSGWLGACSGTTTTCTVAVTEVRSVTAAFAPISTDQFTLTISVTGTGTITSNPAGINCGTDCTESYVSGQSVTLTATAGSGFQFSSWGGACSGSGACVVAMNANRAVTVVFSPRAQDLIFFDNFEYEVGRNALDAANRFMQLGHWDRVKTEQSNEPGANGHLYTVSAIPGYNGSFPGLVSQRVLAMEARPDLGNGQTDFYLEFGSGMRPIGHIPPNHWFQFWVYSPDIPGVDGQRSLYTNAKFIYPNRADYYPATLNNGGYIYILGLNKRSKAPRDLAPCGLDRDVGCTLTFLHAGWNRSQGLTNRIQDKEEDFGANLADAVHVSPNQWTLVKIHMDISGTDPRATPGQAVFEMWIRRFGSSTWIKTTEYIGGVTDVGGGAINFTPAYTDGFRMLRIPTTFGSGSTVPANWLASWTYLDDFTIAASEAALPQYSELPAN